MSLVGYALTATVFWLLWELALIPLSKPVSDGTPVRPPLSVGEWLLGYTRGEQDT